MKGLGLGLAACVGLVGCSAGPGVDIATEVMPSVVLITYGDGPGHGSGFFVEGEPGVCTLLTANHVVQASPLLLISAYDTDERGQPWRAEQILPFPNGVDLAVVTFRPAGNRCPYRALKLGNSDRVRVQDALVTVGYPERDENQPLLKRASELKISSIDPPSPQGYSLVYTGATGRGMSGSPLVNRQGQVMGIHAGADAEFKWAVPIKFFQASFDTVVANAPPISDGAALRQQGWQHWETKDYSAMLAAFEQAIAANSQDVEAWAGKGIALNELGRYEEALETFDKALAINPNYAEAWYNRGVLLSDLGRHEEALASYNKTLTINPESAETWNNRGVLLSNLGRLEDALASHNKALAINPNYAEAWYNRGVLLSNLGRLEDALASYYKAVAINPEFVEAWNNSGNALGNLGRHEEALVSHDKALAINPQDTFNWLNRGVTLRALGRHEEALASYDKALAINPEYAEAWYNRGILLGALGRHEEALASYDKALAINPEDDAAWNNKAYTFVQQGRYQEALTAVEKALVINPNDETSQRLRQLILSKL